jgi:hypothetical protein
LSVAEGWTSTFAVHLAVQPTSDVVVNVARTAGDMDLTVFGTQQLTFNADNWNVDQIITLAAAQDADTADGTATFSVSSAGVVSKTITATEIDDDAPVGPTLLHATDDGYTRDGSYANTNFGTAALLQLKQDAAGYARESFLRFDLSSITSITSAKLRLFGRMDNGVTPSVGFNVYAASPTKSWSESTLTWNNRPAPASSTVIAKATVSGTTGKWYELDLTAFLKQQLAAGATSVTLVLKAAGASNGPIDFDSDEGANRPELVVSA